MSVERRGSGWGIRFQVDGKEFRRALGPHSTRADAVAAERAIRGDAVQQRKSRITGVPLSKIQTAKVHCLYRHYAEGDRLLYVGISLSAMFRLLQHQSSSPWYDQIVTVRIERFTSRREARAAEAKAIATEHPAHNQARPSLSGFLSGSVGQTGQLGATPVHAP